MRTMTARTLYCGLMRNWSGKGDSTCRWWRPNTCWWCRRRSFIGWDIFRGSAAIPIATCGACSTRAHELSAAVGDGAGPELQAAHSVRDFSPSRRRRADAACFNTPAARARARARLHAKRSIGIGGHISADDAAQASAYDEGMRRELEEEVVIDTPYRGRMVGLINDDETEVGRVHLGVVHLFDVEQPGRPAAGKRNHRRRLSARRASCWPICPVSKPGRRFV